MLVVNGLVLIVVAVLMGRKYSSNTGLYNVAFFIGYTGLVLILMGMV